MTILQLFCYEGSGPVFLSNVNCDGTESDISKCGHLVWYEIQADCAHNRDAGVVCRGSASGREDFIVREIVIFTGSICMLSKFRKGN